MKHTSLRRKWRWWWRNGHKRLHAAHLRRRPLKDPYDYTPHLTALRYLLGEHGLSHVMVEFIISIPDVVKRIQAYRSFSRKLTSPRSRFLWRGEP